MYKNRKENVFKRIWNWIKRHKVISIIIAVILVLIIAAVVFIESKLNMIKYDSGVVSTPQSSANDSNDEDEDLTKGLDDATTKFSDSKIFDDKNVTNILLLGTDERTSGEYSENARSDSMMILSINKEKHTAKLVSLERGQGVPILEGEYKDQYDWLTHCFRYGGADLVMKEVQYCYKVKVDRFVQCNFTSFKKIIDAVGGVDIEIKDQYVCDALNGVTQANSWVKNKVSVGINHLDGYDALAYARQRYCDSDWQRVARQRQVIQAFSNKTKDLNMIQFNGLIDTILPLLKTNFSQVEILQLTFVAPSLKGVKLEQMTLPEKGTYGSMKGMDGRSMFAVDFAKNADILQKFLYD